MDVRYFAGATWMFAKNPLSLMSLSMIDVPVCGTFTLAQPGW
jgi:hypothetical protein